MIRWQAVMRGVPCIDSSPGIVPIALLDTTARGRRHPAIWATTKNTNEYGLAGGPICLQYGVKDVDAMAHDIDIEVMRRCW